MEERSGGLRTGVGLEEDADILERRCVGSGDLVTWCGMVDDDTWTVCSVTLDICAVQRRVLERLRELVVDSIHQVVT